MIVAQRLLITAVLGILLVSASFGLDPLSAIVPMEQAPAALIPGNAGSSETLPCPSPPFDTRVELGKEAEEKEEFKAYHSAMQRRIGNHLAETMRACFANVPDPESTPFVLVADITAEGAARAVEVRPATNIASCFAQGFALASFPAPPPYPDHDGFPITIEMHIK
jgi:hypothetical protein